MDGGRLLSAPVVVAVVQARTSSSRLPGKVLAPLAAAPALQRMMERVGRARRVDLAIVATSTEAGDDPVEALCDRIGVPCHRGSLDDVLGRFVGAVPAGAEVVVRLTGDCPLVDPELVDRHIDEFVGRRHVVDYATNAMVRTMPDGLDVEVFSRGILVEAERSATARYDREHVTPWIQRTARRFDVVQAVDLAALRWTLDTPRDYAMISAVYAELFERRPAFGSADIYRVLLDRPELILVAGESDARELDSWRARIETHLAVDGANHA